MSNLCNIIQTLNEYQLDIPIDFIYQQSKLVLKKKPLEFLAKVIVPKSLAQQQHNNNNRPKSNSIEQQHQQLQQQQQNSPKDNQLSSFSFLSFFSSLTNSNANTPKSMENTPKKVAKTKPPLYKQSPLLQSKKIISPPPPPLQPQPPMNVIRRSPSLPRLNHKDYTYNKRVYIYYYYIYFIKLDGYSFRFCM